MKKVQIDSLYPPEWCLWLKINPFLLGILSFSFLHFLRILNFLLLQFHRFLRPQMEILHFLGQNVRRFVASTAVGTQFLFPVEAFVAEEAVEVDERVHQVGAFEFGVSPRHSLHGEISRQPRLTSLTARERSMKVRKKDHKILKWSCFDNAPKRNFIWQPRRQSDQTVLRISGRQPSTAHSTQRKSFYN